jgi:flagellar hook-basal body complex protein FliE
MDPVGMESLLAKLNAARDALGQGSASVQRAGSRLGVDGIADGGVAAGARAGAAKGVDFGTLLKQSIDGVDDAQVQAGRLAEQFQLGNPKVTLEETMVAVQKASLSFQQAVQIRNRVIAAYHDVMNMQV